MAFVPEEDKQNQPQQGQANPAQLPVSTASAPGAGPSAGGKAQAAQSNPQQPFQSLNAYLTANAPQITAQGNKIAGDLTSQYGQVTNDINKATGDFGTRVQSGYAQPNADIGKNAASDPTAFAAKPENVKAFQSLYNDVYSGPENFESSSGYGDLAKEVSGAQQKANLLNTTPGLETYFQGQNPNATAGGNTLDSVLLQGNPEAYTSVQNAAKPYAGLMDMLTQSSATANAAVPQAKQAASDTATALRNQFTGEGGVIPSFQKEFNTNLTNARDTATKTSNAAQSDFLSGKATPEDLAVLGLTPAEYSRLTENQGILQKDFNAPMDLGSYFNTPQQADVAINPSNFASSSDYQKAQALSQLTGMDLTSFLNPADSGQAGTAPKNLVNFHGNPTNDATSSLTKQDTDFLTQDKNNPIQVLYSGSPATDTPQDAIKADVLSRNQNSITPQQMKWLQDYQAVRRPNVIFEPPNTSNNPNLGGTGSPAITTPMVPNNQPTGFGQGGTYIDPKTGEVKKVF